MNTISGVSSATNPHTTTTTSLNALTKIPKELGVIGSNLKSGNLTAAQTALSNFQQNVQGNPPFGMNSQADTDYQNLTAALQAGDLSAAQQAFASLQTDLQSAKTPAKTGQGGPHHHGSGEEPGASLINSLTRTSSTASTRAKSSHTPAGTPASSAADAAKAEVENDGSLLNMTA